MSAGGTYGLQKTACNLWITNKNTVLYNQIAFCRYYEVFVLAFNVIIPFVPWYFWNESLLNAFIISYASRYAFTLNVTWCVNSVCHLWGFKPYYKEINPAENIGVVVFSAGEGYHNFHHTFPQDYSASELNLRLNPSKWLIGLHAKVGLAYDLKTVSKDMVLKRRKRTGDLQQLNQHKDQWASQKR